jgi:3-deoxy-D-manno-octulosonic-acid transferase
MYILYNILIHLVFLFLLPYLILTMAFEGRYRSGLAERFGFIPGQKLKRLSGSRVVWFRAVSVGETKAVIPLVRLFKKRHPEVKVVFSTVTPTGNSVPEAFIVVEKEVWPNLVLILSGQGIPVIVVNGTISDGSFKRYRWGSFFFRPVFSRVAFFCARTEEDARKARYLGCDQDRVVEAGNLKFDWEPEIIGASKAENLLRELRLSPSDPLIVAGSTHAGEEEILVAAFKVLKEEFRGLKLIIAPRHPERFDEVEALLTQSGLSFTRRSTGGERKPDVLLLDTMGELTSVYGLSTVAFVGGTLVDIGGHNLLEPAFFGKPVVYGPYLRSYLYMAEMLEEAGAGVRVTPEDLSAKLGMLLRDEELRAKKGKAARWVVESKTGATERCARVIEDALKMA